MKRYVGLIGVTVVLGLGGCLEGEAPRTETPPAEAYVAYEGYEAKEGYEAEEDGEDAVAVILASEIAKTLDSAPVGKGAASRPTSVMTPATSVPGTNGSGGRRWYLPCTTRLVAKLTPAASIWIPTSSTRVSGIGISTSSSRSKVVHSLTKTPFIRSS